MFVENEQKKSWMSSFTKLTLNSHFECVTFLKVHFICQNLQYGIIYKSIHLLLFCYSIIYLRFYICLAYVFYRNRHDRSFYGLFNLWIRNNWTPHFAQTYHPVWDEQFCVHYSFLWHLGKCRFMSTWWHNSIILTCRNTEHLYQLSWTLLKVFKINKLLWFNFFYRA